MNDNVSIEMTVREWLDVLTDIDAFESSFVDNDAEYYSLEPGTLVLRDLLRDKGVAL